MGSPALIEQLDNAIDALMAKPERALPQVDANVMPLVMIAAELRSLPRPSFKTQLKADLLEKAGARVIEFPILTSAKAGQMWDTENPLPTLFGAGYGTYATQRRNFVASFAAHVVMVALIATSGMWVATHQEQIKQQVTELVAPDLSQYQPLTASKDTLHGGGGGGDRDKLNAPAGKLPKFAMEQIAPPAMVIRNEHPKLAVEPTVVVPPQVHMAMTMPNLGDPKSVIPNGPPSNGTGSGGGLGSGEGGGIGSGRGTGVGPGTGGGMGGGVFKVGGGVTAPRAIFSPDPQYSDEARKAHYQGTVILWVMVGPDGRAHDVKIARSLGMGLDEKAIEAVRTWKFAPAMKDDKPVAVQINVEVNFRLY